MNTEFTNRWLIKGVLTLSSPLHIGDGNSLPNRAPLLNPTDDETIEVNSIVTDYTERPYIPATALKGNLRRFLTTYIPETKDGPLTQLFGTSRQNQRGKEDDWYGGKVSFSNSKLLQSVDYDSVSMDQKPPAWCSKRSTGVLNGVAIDRVTGVAAAAKLWHYEYVPEGTSFEVCIEAENVSEEEIEHLLAALEAFNVNNANNANIDRVTLGAHTGEGFGKATWELKTLKVLGKDEATAWLSSNEITELDSFYKALAVEAYIQKAAQRLQHLNQNRPPRLKINLQLDFESLFLVNDAYRVKYDKKQVDEGHLDSSVDHYPRLNERGEVYLPASSFRGAFRAQAERILATCLKNDAASFEKVYKEDEALEVDRSKDTIEHRSNLNAIGLNKQLFGLTGWRSPIDFSDFTLTASSKRTTVLQEFVAIDRFTGGGMDSAKFNAQGYYQPQFEGCLDIDLRRISTEELGLLTYSLIDLVDGDITFGFGASKGYGACSARITSVESYGSKTSWRSSLETLLTDLDTLDKTWYDGQKIEDNAQAILETVVESFQTKVKEAA